MPVAAAGFVAYRTARLSEQLRLVRRDIGGSRELSKVTARCEVDPLAVLFTLGLAAIFAGDCPTTAAREAKLALKRHEARARALTARRIRAQRRVDAARRELAAEAQLARRTRAKAHAARAVVGGDVSCVLRDGRLRVRLTLRNGHGARVEAIVRAGYVVRGADGRRVATAPATGAPVSLGRGQRRELDIDAGAPPSGDGAVILACEPRLQDVRLSEFPVGG